jgi:hypothetical protein
MFLYISTAWKRKALVDSADQNFPDAEFRNLFNEVGRLRSVFSENRSFRGYSTQLLEAMSILRPDMNLATDLDSASGFSNGMQFKLALRTVHEVAVSAELALNWVINHTPSMRCVLRLAAVLKSLLRFSNSVTPSNMVKGCSLRRIKRACV